MTVKRFITKIFCENVNDRYVFIFLQMFNWTLIGIDDFGKLTYSQNMVNPKLPK